MVVLIVVVMADPEPQYSKNYPEPPSYQKKSAKPSYKADYCDPRAPPACVQSPNDTFCLKVLLYFTYFKVNNNLLFSIFLVRITSTQTKKFKYEICLRNKILLLFPS